MFILEGTNLPADKNREYMLQRDYIADAMEDSRMYSPQAVERVRDCCSFELFSWNPEKKRRKTIKLNRCKNRCCPICQHLDHVHKSGWLKYADEKLRKQAEELQHHKISDQVWYNRYKFITISPFESMPIEEVASALVYGKSILCALRNSGKDFIVGHSGMWLTCEVTYKPSTGLFHPHYHMLVYWDYKAPYFDDVRKKRIHDYVLRKVKESAFSKEALMAKYPDRYPEQYKEYDSEGNLLGQRNVSIDYAAVRLKEREGSVSPEYCFELTKYITKVTSFINDYNEDEENFAGAKIYVDLMKRLADRHIARMQGSGVLKYSASEYKAFIQNANFV